MSNTGQANDNNRASLRGSPSGEIDGLTYRSPNEDEWEVEYTEDPKGRPSSKFIGAFRPTVGVIFPALDRSETEQPPPASKYYELAVRRVYDPKDAPWPGSHKHITAYIYAEGFVACRYFNPHYYEYEEGHTRYREIFIGRNEYRGRVTYVTCQGDEETRRADRQRKKVYRAETVLMNPWAICYRDILKCRAFIEQCMDTPWFREHFPRTARRGLAVKPARGNATYSSANDYALHIKPFDFNTAVLLHELGHSCCSNDGAGDLHGPSYARIFLMLVRQFIGLNAYVALKTSFRAHGVEVAKVYNTK